MDFGSVDIDSYNKYTFGKCIRLHRQEKGISLRSVAADIGISPTYLSGIEKGYRHAPISNMDIFYKLLKALDIPEEQTKFVIDMAYSTYGCHHDIVNYLSECEKAKKFIRCAIELELSDDDWDSLLEQLNEKKKEKVLTK